MPRPRGRNKFQDNWLEKEEYKLWLAKKNESCARCKICSKDISVESIEKIQSPSKFRKVISQTGRGN